VARAEAQGGGEATRVSRVPVDGPIKDAADFNDTFPEPGTGTGLPDLAMPGEVIRGKPVIPLGTNTPGSVVWQIDSGWTMQSAADGTITYAFYNGKHAAGLVNSPKFGEGLGYTPFNAEQQAAARVAIQSWDDLIAPDFVEVTGAGSSEYAKADILLANTYTGPAQAWAYYPYDLAQYKKLGGDVWIADPRLNTSNAQLDPGQYGLQTLNHELGHSLGLSHPGNYNFSDDVDGVPGPDPITYEGDAFYYQDSNQYTIMSYFDAFETGSDQIDWSLMRFVYPSTPMVHDVYVAQQKYGVETTTRTADTTYGFNATADVENEAMRFEANELLTMFTIWDAAGNDTLDLSGYDSNSVIDLREGAYSSAGGPGEQLSLAEVNANNAAAGLADRTAAYDLYIGGRAGANEGIAWADIVNTDFVMDNNIGIAYGAVIENAIGGSGDDQINGNQADNEFTGNAGADMFVLANYSGIAPLPTDPTRVIVDTSVDTITDFESGTDTIDVSAYDANTAMAGDQAFTYIGSAEFTNIAGQLRTYVDEDGINYLAGDINGDGRADFIVNLAHSGTSAGDLIL
jgi:serralysin